MDSKEILMHKEKSAQFQSDGSAYVHTEMKDGKTPQTILCGDFMAMLWCIQAEINRISELTNTSFGQTLSIIAMNYKLGKDNVDILTKDMPSKSVKGSFAEMEDAIRKEVQRKDSKLEDKIDKLKSELKSAKSANDILKVKLEKQEKEHFLELQKKEKKIMALDHECDRLTKILRGEKHE